MQRERCCAGFELTPCGRLELEPEAEGVAIERDRTAHVRDIDHDIVDLAEHDLPPSKGDPTYGVAYWQDTVTTPDRPGHPPTPHSSLCPTTRQFPTAPGPRPL